MSSSPSPSAPLLLAGHPALEFLNSTMSPRGETVELIGDGRAFVSWLVAVDLLDEPTAAAVRRRFSASVLDALAADARKLRAWATSWLGRWTRSPGADYGAELERLNAILAEASSYRQLAREHDRLVVIEHARTSTPKELVALLANHLAELIAHEQPELVKRCEGNACTLWFVDRTKAHRRRFCSPALCGNRDKVAAFRDRQRRDS